MSFMSAPGITVFSTNRLNPTGGVIWDSGSQVGSVDSRGVIADSVNDIWQVHRATVVNVAHLQCTRRDDQGKLRRFVNVFVGEEDIRFLDGADTKVAGGDEVAILPAVAGG